MLLRGFLLTPDPSPQINVAGGLGVEVFGFLFCRGSLQYTGNRGGRQFRDMQRKGNE